MEKVEQKAAELKEAINANVEAKITEKAQEINERLDAFEQKLQKSTEQKMEEKSFKSDIVLTKLNKIDFVDVNIINYGYGDPNKIHDIYELELTSNKGKVYNYEFTGTDIVRFYHQGSIVEKNGDIIAISVQKIMDALNKYYS